MKSIFILKALTHRKNSLKDRCFLDKWDMKSLQILISF